MKHIKNKDDKIYYLSAFLGLLAGNMFNYSLVIFSHSLSENESFASQVFFIAYIPFLFFSFRAGYALDKYSRKTVIALSQLLTFISAFIPGFLAYNGFLHSGNREILYFFAFANGIGMSFTMPGRFAILGDLVESSKITKATIYLNIMILVGFASAPIVAGFVRESFSYGTLLMVTGSIYYLSTTILVLFVHIPHVRQHNHPHRKQAFQEFLAFIKKESIVFQALLAMLLGMVIVGPMQVFVPEFGKKVLSLSESERGILMGTLGLGLLSGSIAANIFGSSSKRGLLVIVSIIASGIFLFIVGLNSHSLFVGILLFSGGFFLGGLTSFLPSIIQECTPNQLRGRVMSFFTLIFLLTPAISGLFYGGLTQWLNLNQTISLAGGITTLLGLFALFKLKKLRAFS